MIAKDHTAPATNDRFQRAGDEAERQMAFYLKRAFGDDPQVQVFHNLRLEDGQDVAQIDHLILHRSGAIIIESKSVTSSVRINERDEWAREWNGRWTGMPSPVLQAKRQEEVLRKVLDGRREELLGKIVFGLVQKGFGAFVIDVLVAISDRGVIQHRGQLPEVRKADQVPDRVRSLIREHVALAHPLSKDPRSKDWGVTLKPEELVRTTAFLRAAHREKGGAPTPTPVRETVGPAVGRHGAGVPREPYLAVGPVVEATPQAASVVQVRSPAVPVFSCQKCQGTQLEVTYGKYGYYFKCRSCDGNTRIELKCPKCSGKARTRKEKQQFFSECQACGTSDLYYTNP